MGQTLYLECESGISGDMVVGALLDLGANEQHLRDALASLPVDGYRIEIGRKVVSGIDCCDFDVVLDAEHENHDHDMAYLYGDLDGEHADEHHHGHHDHEHGHDHEHDHEHEHHHEHDHEHEHHHEHRNLAQIERIIDGGELTPRANSLAKRIFSIVAEAESKAHGLPLDEVHFHEVGAVDSIVDVVAAAVCLDDLDVTDAVVGPLAEGHGRVRTQHGVLSIPVPAVASIASTYGLVLSRHDAQGEFVTPTGAAIAAAIRTADELPASYVIKATGTGSGKRAYEPISTVRAMLIEPRAHAGKPEHAADAHGCCGHGHGQLWKLETEVDDCTGEALGHALDRLYAVGAREAHYIPVYMKKDRPAYQVEVLCAQDHVRDVERVLFEETTTIGVRRYPVERTALPRREVTVQTSLGTAQAKVVTLPSGLERAYPEHDTVVALAETAGVPYQEAYRAVLAALGE